MTNFRQRPGETLAQFKARMQQATELSKARLKEKQDERAGVRLGLFGEGPATIRVKGQGSALNELLREIHTVPGSLTILRKPVRR